MPSTSNIRQVSAPLPPTKASTSAVIQFRTANFSFTLLHAYSAKSRTSCGACVNVVGVDSAHTPSKTIRYPRFYLFPFGRAFLFPDDASVFSLFGQLGTSFPEILHVTSVCFLCIIWIRSLLMTERRNSAGSLRLDSVLIFEKVSA